ncbi:hypothetical protein [Corynebacterium comes]|uniref:Uncharacterized protein n=1 Tax=Corynebacterium comes TaxID=2675218 RepID=A0A6B8VLP9_9CORY|nr:hypothetical protein [Corynebacterium comes]QGU03979.1 hypothetical protein CETAM_03520 [Corynebacterium comes]
MPSIPTLTDLSTAREARRVKRFGKFSAFTPRWLDFWRTPTRTRTLVAVYLTTVAIGFFSLVAGVWLPAAFIVYVGSIFALAVSWTILRATIGTRDSAPRSLLDVQETEVLDLGHRIGFRVLCNLNLLMAFIVLVSAVLTDGSLPLSGGLALGAALLHTVFLASSLPAVGYALAFTGGGRGA